jgi:prepilin-type N-terminal cleavage/methylation domain-containing protein
MSQRGFSLVEMVVAAAIVLVVAAARRTCGLLVEAHLLGAGRQFKGVQKTRRSR